MTIVHYVVLKFVALQLNYITFVCSSLLFLHLPSTCFFFRFSLFHLSFVIDAFVSLNELSTPQVIMPL